MSAGARALSPDDRLAVAIGGVMLRTLREREAGRLSAREARAVGEAGVRIMAAAGLDLGGPRDEGPKPKRRA
jgi:hypothetical protein